ncbi:MAG: hypothetical protein ACRBBR_09835 [Cellvibrionaceae bacterium]
MIVGRVIGWIFFVIALALLGGEIVSSLQAGEWTPQLLGQLWFELDSGSLNLVQAVIQRYLLPALWDPIILTLLLWPAWTVFLIPGILFVIFFRKRSNKYAPKKYLG